MYDEQHRPAILYAAQRIQTQLFPLLVDPMVDPALLSSHEKLASTLPSQTLADTKAHPSESHLLSCGLDGSASVVTN